MHEVARCPLTDLIPHSGSGVMASASSTSAKNLFVDSKTRLAERVQLNVSNMGSICRQVNRGSQSADMLTHSARNMALQVRCNALMVVVKYCCE